MMICYAWTPVWISRTMLYISEVSVFFVQRTTWSISLQFEVIIRLTCSHFLFLMCIISSTCCIPYKYGRYSTQNRSGDLRISQRSWTESEHLLLIIYSPPLTPFPCVCIIPAIFIIMQRHETLLNYADVYLWRLSPSSRAFGFRIRAQLLTAVLTCN